MGEHRKKLRATSFTFTLYMTIVPFFEWVLGKRSGNLHECVVTEGRLFQYLGNCKFFVRSPQVYHGIRIQPMQLQCTDCPIFIFFPGVCVLISKSIHGLFPVRPYVSQNERKAPYNTSYNISTGLRCLKICKTFK